MARKTVVPTQVSPQQGVHLPFVTVDLVNGMQFYNNGSTLLLVRNRSMDVVQVVIISVPDEAGRVGNYEQDIPAFGTGLFGPYKQSWWNQTFVDSGYIWFTVSTDVDVSVSAITLF
jgi:hypothetical protein